MPNMMEFIPKLDVNDYTYITCWVTQSWQGQRPPLKMEDVMFLDRDELKKKAERYFDEVRSWRESYTRLTYKKIWGEKYAKFIK